MTLVLPMVLLIADSSALFVYALPIIGFMLVFYGVFEVVRETRSSSQRRVHARLRGQRRKQEDKVAATILRRGAMGSGAGFADAVIGNLRIVPKLQTMLDQADVEWSASKTLLNLAGLALLTAVGGMLVQLGIAGALGCAAAVFALPLMWLSFKRSRRMVKLNGQLPDVFEMMSQALRAGQSLGGAVQLIYEQMPPPIATEFAQVYHEQNLGVKIEEALLSMSRRVDSLDVKFFVTAVLIQRQTGGDLAEVLDNISEVIRGRIELAGMVRALTAEGRLSGWVLFALPFIVFAATMYLNPEYGNTLLEDKRGQIMLMVAAGLQLMGIAMIRWIVNIKV